MCHIWDRDPDVSHLGGSRCVTFGIRPDLRLLGQHYMYLVRCCCSLHRSCYTLLHALLPLLLVFCFCGLQVSV
jgi:hypothetical protein